MSRSVWKCYSNTLSLIKLSTKYIPVKTYSRASTILPFMFNKKLLVHNGKKFVLVSIKSEMLYHKVGEFVQTRSFFKFTKKGKKKKK